MIDPPDKVGILKHNSWGRWEIWRPRATQPLWHITSGDIVYLRIAGHWRETSIEYDQQAKAYYAVDGSPLIEGAEAGIP